MANQHLVDEFATLIGSDDTDKIARLLEVYDWDLNGAAGAYFDTGFESIDHRPAPVAEAPVHSGAELHEHLDLSHRGELANLQSQMILDDFLPRLPKAPRIPNRWPLEVGLHVSMRESKEKEASAPALSLRPAPRTDKYLWVVLLLIPRTLLNVILSVVKYLFGRFDAAPVHRLPQAFDYDNYQPDWPESLAWESSANIVHTNFNEVHAQVGLNYDWLVVVLINNSPESGAFARKLVANPQFTEMFGLAGAHKESLIYINNVDAHPEAFEVAHVYKAKRTPYVMLVGNVSNNPLVMASMSMVYKSNILAQFIADDDLAEATAAKVVRNLHKLIEHYNPQLITKKIDKQEIELSRIIKEQQDDAYLKSLEKDKIKKHNEQILKQRQLDLEASAKAREAFLFSLIKDDWFDKLNHEGTTKIAIKLPTGKRIIESISQDILVTDLYLYVETRIHLIEMTKSTFTNEDEAITHIKEQQVDPMAYSDYLARFPFRFELIQPFPKKVIAPTGLVSEVPELRLGANLLVEYVEDDESGSE